MNHLTKLVAVCWFIATTLLFFIPRNEFYLAWPVYTISFAAYVIMLGKGRLPVGYGICLFLAIRLVGLNSTPLLSDDYHRFIWDGWLTTEGIHPVTYQPNEVLALPDTLSIPHDVYAKLNSQSYYTPYPPVAQLVFSGLYKISNGDPGSFILYFKLLLILTDALILYLLYRLLDQLQMSTARTWWYGLNPLVILEFTGNLHFDGVMIAGLLGAIWFMSQRKYYLSGLGIALSVLAKMTSLMLVPFSSRHAKQLILPGCISIFLIFGAGWLYYGQQLHWYQSVAQWYNRFEFNAGIYYLLREAGYWLKGYNMVAIIGPVLSVVTITFLFGLWLLFRSRMSITPAKAMTIALTGFLLLSPVVHPWYIIMVMAVGILAGYFFPVIWTYLVFLSYSHYNGGQFEEQYLLIACEYVLLTSWIVFELAKGWKQKAPDALPSGA